MNRNILNSENGGYIVPVEYGQTRLAAAMALLENESFEPFEPDGESWDRIGIIRLARTADPKPSPFFNSEQWDDGDWYTTNPCSDYEWQFAFDGWLFDCATAHLEECIKVDES